MWRIIIYLFPVFINMMLGGMFYICAYRLAEDDYSKIIATCGVAMWSLIYCLGTLGMGRITTARRAPALIIISGCALAVFSIGFIVVPGELMQFLWIGLMGIGTAGYCTPFQVFANDLESSKSGGVVRTTAMYTVSWSLGMALGPSLFGVLGTHWQIGYYVNAAMALAMVAGTLYIIYLKKHGLCKSGTELAKTGEAPVNEYAGKPNLVVVGWIGIGMGSLVVAGLRALLPVFAENMNIGNPHGGLILGTICYTQVVISLLIICGRRWMYGWKVMVLTSLVGIVGLLLFAFTLRIPLLYLAMFLYGIYSSVFYFMGVFHSLVHPTKNAQYISVNEALVGICGIIGSIGSGLLADNMGFTPTFIVLGILTVGTVVAQLLVRRCILRKAGEK